MDQNSALKKEAAIAERKLLARNERIQNLEALLQDADRRLTMSNQKFEAQLQQVRDRLEQARSTSISVLRHLLLLMRPFFSSKVRLFYSLELRSHRQASARRRRCFGRRVEHESHGWIVSEPAVTNSERGRVSAILWIR